MGLEVKFSGAVTTINRPPSAAERPGFFNRLSRALRERLPVETCPTVTTPGQPRPHSPAPNGVGSENFNLRKWLRVYTFRV